MEIQGKIKLIGETQTFGSNGFRKRELVIVTEDQYPQPILIEFVQDKCDLLNKYQVRQTAKVSINLRGREWLDPKTNTNRYFNSIQGWRIEALEVSTQQPQPPQSYEPSGNGGSDNDDLPF